jgi:MFS family permease
MATQAGSLLATRRGRLTLLLLCAVQFLDIADSSIMNVALPSIRRDLGFSVQGLQWVLSGYLLTYGGFLLLGGRAADLLGRRRLLVAGTTLFAACSLAGGLAVGAGMLIAARLGQGVGAAMMAPAGLSILTTTFSRGTDRNRALGVWGAVSGLPPPPASSWAACCRRARAGAGSCLSTCRSARRSSPAPTASSRASAAA